MTAAVAEAKASAYETAMRIVFAPNTTRSAVQSNTGGGYQLPDGGYRNTNNFESRNDQTTEGYFVPATPGEQSAPSQPGHKSSI